MEREEIVFVPGLNCTAKLFQPVTERLAGRSAVFVADSSVAASVGGIAEAVLDRAAPRFHLCGLSLGGYVAFEILRRAPERVTRLALLNTSARPDPTDRPAARREQVSAAQQPGGFAPVVEAQYRAAVHPARHEDEALRALHAGMAASVGPQGFARQIEAIITRPDSRPLLPAIQVPTLVLVGEEDAITPPELALEMVQGLSRAEFERVAACGHLSTIERPRTVSERLLAFFG